MSDSITISLTHHMPQGFWTATASNARSRRILGGMFTSAEAALAACWLTTDERISLPTIATHAEVRELLDARAEENTVTMTDAGVPS
jgi:hypothetical protein